ncbi:MAG TPA: hypothetical protein VIL78_11425, partial [Hanamia sp.]
MKDWFHAILEHLYKTYPLDHSFHNINDFLITDLNVDSKIPNHLHRLSAVISILKQKGYIDGNPQPAKYHEARGNVIGVVNRGAGFEDINSLLTHTIEIRLTIDGFVYMQDRELKAQEHQSVIITNKISRRTNIWTPIILLVTVIISGVSLFKQFTSQTAVQYREQQQKARA